jgi:hypothetical protein
MKLERIKKPFLGEKMKSLAKNPSFSAFLPLWMALVILTVLCFGWSTALVSRSFACSLSTVSSPFDFGNQTFELGHEALHFTNGFYESPDRQHVASLTERGMNQSGTKAAAILIDNPAGSGIFSYAVGAVRTDGTARYSEPVFLGDRIKIEAVSVGAEAVTIHYLTHPANAPLATEPTKPITVIYAFQDDGSLHVTQ